MQQPLSLVSVSSHCISIQSKRPLAKLPSGNSVPDLQLVHANNWYLEPRIESLGAMSTSSQRARAVVAAAAADVAAGAYLEAGAVVNLGADCARRLAAAEAAAT